MCANNEQARKDLAISWTCKLINRDVSYISPYVCTINDLNGLLCHATQEYIGNVVMYMFFFGFLQQAWLWGTHIYVRAYISQQWARQTTSNDFAAIWTPAVSVVFSEDCLAYVFTKIHGHRNTTWLWRLWKEISYNNKWFLCRFCMFVCLPAKWNLEQVIGFTCTEFWAKQWIMKAKSQNLYAPIHICTYVFIYNLSSFCLY